MRIPALSRPEGLALLPVLLLPAFSAFLPRGLHGPSDRNEGLFALRPPSYRGGLGDRPGGITETIVSAGVDSRRLSGEFSGREFDLTFLSELPSNVDPCGENGEFHSFAYDGTIFRDEIPISSGQVVLRDKYFFISATSPRHRRKIHSGCRSGSPK